MPVKGKKAPSIIPGSNLEQTSYNVVHKTSYVGGEGAPPYSFTESVRVRKSEKLCPVFDWAAG
jgi:hypothetical protein